jgi:AAA15 family ATPase/GTPase
MMIAFAGNIRRLSASGMQPRDLSTTIKGIYMSITSITIENFKSIKDKVKIDFKPITLLFGPNSAGKSTIIQALHFAWEVIGRHNLNPKSTEYGGQSIDFGGFENIVYGHDKSRSVRMRFDFDLCGVSLPQYADEDYKDGISYVDHTYKNVYSWNPSEVSKKIESASVEFTISWDNVLEKFRVSTYKIYFNNELTGVMEAIDGQSGSFISYINFCHPILIDTNYRSDLEKYVEDKEDSCSCKEMNIDFLEVLCQEALDDHVHWLDLSCIHEKDYERFKKAVSLQIEANDIFSGVFLENPEELSSSIKDKLSSGELSEDEKENIKLQNANKYKEAVETLSKLRSSAFKIMVPYEFWLYTKLFFSFKTLNSPIAIECQGQKDALPDCNRLLDLQLPEEKNKKLDELNHSDFYFEAIRSAISQIFLAPGKILKDELKKLLYLGPIRSRIPRNYEPDSFIDNRRWSEGLAAWDVLHSKDQNFIDKVNYWVDDRLQTGYQIQKETPSQIKIIDKNGFKLRPLDVGVGFSQILPIVVGALYAREGFVAVEQPELHIHPALQAEMGDLLIESALQCQNFFLLETHSEHLILRILRRIRETAEGELEEGATAITPDMISVLYVQPGENGSKVIHIPVNEDGEFDRPWPQGFFAERAKELF